MIFYIHWIWFLIITIVSTEPLNLNATNITSTSFCITFDPPTNITQNGLITSYNVTYQGDLFNTTEYNTTVSVNTVVYPLIESSSVCISNLEEYNNYTVLIRAVNGAGEGAAAMIAVETLEAGSYKNLTSVNSTLCKFKFIYLAPTASPQSVSGLNITSISINVCFNPPPTNDQNGIITFFNITYSESPFQTASVTVNVPVELIAYPLDGTVCRNLTNLQQNNDYSITVIAINSQGPGPVSQSIVITTNEAGGYTINVV